MSDPNASVVPPNSTTGTALPADLPEYNPHLRYADFSSRLFATTLDLLLCLLLLFPVGMELERQFPIVPTPLTPEMTPGEMLRAMAASGQLQLMLASNLLSMTGFLMLVGICWILFGTTPGKLLLGLRIVRSKDGQTPGMLRFLARLIGYLLSGLPVLLGFLWVLGGRRRRGWHDYLAGTAVIIDRRRQHWPIARVFFWLRDRIIAFVRRKKQS